MSSKKPLNFAQALRAKAGEQKAADVEPLKEIDLTTSLLSAAEPFPTPILIDPPKILQSEIIEPNNWTARRPEPDTQTAGLDGQTAGHPAGQTATKENESRYPSRRNRTKITARLPAQKVEKYKLWCHLNKIDLQDAIEQGLDIITGLLDGQTARRLGGWTPAYQYDDLDDSLTTDDISSFYSKLTKNKWTDNDRKALEEVSHLAPHILKIGVVTSMLRAKQRINSFRYCLGAIQEAADTNVGVDYLDYVVSHLGKRAREGK